MQNVKKNQTALITAVIVVLVIIGATFYSKKLAAPVEPVAAPAATAPAETVTGAPASQVETASAPAATTDPATAASPTEIGATAWSVIEGESRLGFEGDYSGSGFSGQFPRFTALIHFDPERLGDSSFDVSIDTTSVTTFNADWDSNLGKSEWFDFSRYPKATFVTHAFRKLEGEEFMATGTLDLKGHQKDVELRFRWTTNEAGTSLLDGQVKLLGDAEVNRRDFRIGDGDWYEDSTIGFTVMVKVSLLLEKSSP